MELRRTLGIRVKDPMSITVDGERIIVSKHADSCVLCGVTEHIVRVNDRPLCESCIAAVKAL